MHFVKVRFFLIESDVNSYVTGGELFASCKN